MSQNSENNLVTNLCDMSRFLWIIIPLVGTAWFIGHYFNNPVPPNMEESSFYNVFVGLVSILIDLVSNDLDFLLWNTGI